MSAHAFVGAAAGRGGKRSRNRAQRLAARQRRLRRRRRTILFVIFLPPALALFWWMRPVPFGGDTAYVIVAGNSMQPTYAPGDLVVTRAQPEYEMGDVVLYRVPDGEPGENLRVIHRIAKDNPDGTYETQGDNRDRPDQWHPAAEDIEGEPRFVVRGLGIWLRKFVDPLVLATVMGISILWACWPAPDGDPKVGRRRRRRPNRARSLRSA